MESDSNVRCGKVMNIYDEPKIDCHNHVIDPARFPYAADTAYRPAGQEIGSAPYFMHVLDAYGVRHALLVGPNSGYGTDNRCLLDAIARLCGFPGKLGMDGSQVAAAFSRGEIDAIRNYCETDVANTYLLFQRFQLIRGAIDSAEYEKEMAVLRAFLEAQSAPHWREFAAAWR